MSDHQHLAETPQLDFDGLARTDHPDTSHAAAVAIKPSTGRLRALVLAYLDASGGATDEEIITAIPGASANGIRPRRVELVADGLVRDSGTRRPTRSGRTAIVWEVV